MDSPSSPGSIFEEEVFWPVACLYIRTEYEHWNHTMNCILENQRQAIAQACRRHGVIRLDAFGSALRDDFTPGESDLDLQVEFGPMEPYARVEAYFGLLGEFRILLCPKIDLVMAGAVKNPYIASNIERTKRMLYAA